MSLRDRLAEHWQLRLLSVAFAVALWLFVASQDQMEAVYTVPLELTDPPAGLAVTSIGVEMVVVRVEGPRTVLATVHEGDFRAEVSLREAAAGRFVATILPRNITTPRGVRVLRVSPSRVRATLEPR